jgi:hypothetical protein
VRAVIVDKVDGIVPLRRLLFNIKEESREKPNISEGIVPERSFEAKLIVTTSLAAEQVRPVQTGEEHLLATLTQFQAGIFV